MGATQPIILHDNGRRMRFIIRHMPALQMEAWLERAAELLPECPDTNHGHPGPLATEILRRGAFGLARAGEEQAAALQDEMLGYCSFVDPENGEDPPCSRENIGSLLHDVWPLLVLRRAVLREQLFAHDRTREQLLPPKETAFRHVSVERTATRPVNMSLTFTVRISQGEVSLNGLRDGSDFDDAPDPPEAVNARNYH